jgi:hypothetical protein
MTKNKEGTDHGRPSKRPLVRHPKKFLLDILVELEKIVNLPVLAVGYFD